MIIVRELSLNCSAIEEKIETFNVMMILIMFRVYMKPISSKVSTASWEICVFSALLYIVKSQQHTQKNRVIRYTGALPLPKTLDYFLAHSFKLWGSKKLWLIVTTPWVFNHRIKVSHSVVNCASHLSSGFTNCWSRHTCNPDIQFIYCTKYSFQFGEENSDEFT